MKIKPPPFSKSEIVARAEDLVDEYCRILGGKRELVKSGLQFDRLYEELIYPNYGIELDEGTDLGVDEAGQKIFGYFEPSTNKVYIDNSLRHDPRRPFTLWHEVGGHGILQGAWLRQQIGSHKTGFVTTEQDLLPGTINALERQANLFASHAAAPSWLVDAMIVRVFRPRRPFLFFKPGKYWLEVNGLSQSYYVSSFDDLCQTIAWQMQSYFGYLSKEALGYRVSESGWVIGNNTKPSIKLFRRSREPVPVRELVRA